MTVKQLINKLEKLEKLSSPDTEITWNPYLNYTADINDVWLTEYENGTVEISLSDYAGEEFFGKRTFV